MSIASKCAKCCEVLVMRFMYEEIDPLKPQPEVDHLITSISHGNCYCWDHRPWQLLLLGP